MSDTDTFTTTTHTSWLGRFGGSMMGVLVGVILFFASFFMLYWNEGRAVDAMIALNAGATQVIPVSAESIQPANEGKLVHVSGPIAVAEPLIDPVFHIAASGALRLERHVEMYQWREEKESKTESKVGGGETTSTTYRYVKDWSDSPIDSNAFERPQGHANPAMPHRGTIIDARTAKLGAFVLDQSQIEQIAEFEPLPPRPDAKLPRGFRWNGEQLYRGNSPDEPRIGDLRVSFSHVPARPISVVAAQLGGTLAGFHGERGQIINLVSVGAHTAEAMFQRAKDEEAILTWILRAVGFVMMVIGLMLMAGPLAWLASVLPFLATLVSAASFGMALIIATPLTLITIAAAWLIHRPLIGGGLIVTGLAAAYFIKRVIPAKKTEQIVAQP